MSNRILEYRRSYAACFCLCMAMLFMLAPAFGQNAGFTADHESGCAPLTVAFTNTSDNNALSYSWNFGNGGAGATTRDASRLYLDPGTYTVTLTVTYPGATKTFSRTITVYESPTPEFSVSATTGCTPLQVEFTDRSLPGSGTVRDVVWDFGDGYTATGASASHLFEISGSFSISTIVTNSFGCSKGITKTRLITVEETPKVDFSANITGSCTTPLPVNFFSTGPEGLTYSWDFGDPASGADNTSTARHPSHVFTREGRYTVTLRARTAGGCEAVVTKQSYVVIEKTKADFSLNGPACAGAPVSFINNTMPRPTLSTWTFPDNSVANTTNAQYQFAAPGAYEVTLQSGLPGCLETVTKTISVHERPGADFSATPVNSCAVPFSTQFTSLAQGATAWAWVFGDGGTSAEASPAHTYTRFGNYNVTLRVENTYGCSDAVTKPGFVQLQEPLLDLTTTAVEGCVPLDVTFTTELRAGGPVTAWHWDLGDGTTSTDAQPTHTYTRQGRYTVKLVAELAGGCRLERETYVLAGDVPVIAFDANPKMPCASETVSFTNQSQPRGTAWQWAFPDDNATSSLENPERQFHTIGQHDVTLRVYNSGCWHSLTKTDFITILPPIADFGVIRQCTDRYKVIFADASEFGPAPPSRSWKWDFGDGTTSIEQNPVHTFAAPGAYRVRLTISNGTCENQMEREVHILDEKPVIHTTQSSICAGTPALISRDALNEGAIGSWSWQWGDGNYSPHPGTAVSKTYHQPGTYQVQLRIVDTLGCLSTSNVIEMEVKGAIADFSVSGRNCRLDEMQFTDASGATHGQAVTSWTWSFNDGSADETVTTQPVGYKHAFTNTGIYNVQLQVTDAAGCRTNATKPVQVTGVTPQFRSAGTIACLNQGMQFNSTSSGSNLQYVWDFGDNTTSTAANPQKQYARPGVYNVSLTVTGGPGCTETIVKERYMTVPDPQAKFSVPLRLEECPPVLLKTTNQSTGHIRSVWDFGDGSRSSLNEPSHVYNLPGTYTVQLQVYSEGECMSTATRDIKIDGPVGTRSWTPLGGCVPLQAGFTATSANAVKYIWDFDDGTVKTTTGNTVQYTYDKPGVYSPRVILEDAKGCQVPAQGPRQDIVADQVKAAFVVDDTRACDAGEVFFTDRTTALSKDQLGQALSYSWDFGYVNRADDVSNAQNPSFLYTGPGTYTAKLEVTSAYGCKNVVTGPVTVEHLPQPSISRVNTICAGDSIRLAGYETKNLPGTKWTWMVDGQPYALTGPAPAPRLAFSEPGLHTVDLVIRNENNKCPNTATVNINVHPLPALNVTPRQATICLGQSLPLQSNSDGATLSWTNYNISSPRAANPSVSPARDTLYRVQAVNQFGCTRYDSARISVSQPFTVQAASAEICSGKQTQLRATGAVSYKWLPATGLNRPDVGDPLASPAATTNYRVIGYGRDNCFTDTAEVRLTVHPSPVIQTGGAREVYAGTSVTLQVRGSNDVIKWNWYPNQWISCTDCPNPEIRPKGDVTYNITATNAQGCQTIALLPVKLVCPGSTAFIPNTFSPNGDGQNDVFYIRGGGISAVRSFRIFNRWGQLVFERTNCRTDDPSCGWDGRINGQLATPEVYIYFVELLCDTNEPLMLKGNVTVLR